MPVVIPERVIGKAGKAFLDLYTDPRFMFMALTELEDLFVNMLTAKFQDFESDKEVREPPPIVPAYNPGDRKFYAVIVEAQLNTLSSQGLGKNKFELQYQPTPSDPNTIETYIGYSGDISCTVEIYCNATSRFAACYIADWVFAGLSDPLCRKLAGDGIEIPYNAIRFSGKVIERQSLDGQDKFWGITYTIPGILIPWARLYKVAGPVIEDFRVAPAATGLGLTISS